tara:strand:+ start:185 stop:736 length:552 start_codon:yes stop_codon:yes gene_type:complete
MSLTVTSLKLRQVKIKPIGLTAQSKSCPLLNSLVLDIKELANRKASEKGFEVIAVELHTHQNPMNIQLQIRPKGGGDVSIDDCALLSAPISEAFDQSELIINPYVLEISSPGITEFLQTDRDFETFKGFPVEVNFVGENQENHKTKGLLYEKSNAQLKLNCKGRIIIIPLVKVLKVRLTTSKE